MARKSSKSTQSTEAQEVLATPLSGAAVSALNRAASRLAREAGLAAVSFGTAKIPTTIAGAFQLLESVGGDQETVLSLLEEWQGKTKRDLLQVVAPRARRTTDGRRKKATPAKKAAAAKPATKKATAKPKAKVQQHVEPEAKAINLEAAVTRLAKAPEGHWLLTWWPERHPAEAKQIGLKADGTVVKGSMLAKAIKG